MKFIVCSHFRVETKQALKLLGVEAEVVTFPAHCAHPPTDWDSIFSKEDASGEPCFVIGGCCNANLDVSRWPEQRIILHHIAQCFYMFMQPEVVDYYIGQGYHLMTPGWLEGWKKQVEHVMGFDQPTARKCYQETAKKLLLVNTGVYADSAKKLADISAYLDIPSQNIEVGLSHYSHLLQRLINDAQVEEDKSKLKGALRQQSEYAMVTDLLGRLTNQKNEYDIIQSLIKVFQVLLAPQQCSYIPWEDETFGSPECTEPNLPTTDMSSTDVQTIDYAWLGDDGFWVKINSEDETFGFITVENVSFPQYRTDYLNMALLIRNVATLAISHARDFQKLSDLSHDAGKAEVAREVIHNAGNVLNSVNISVEQLESSIEKSAVNSLPAIVDLMKEQGDKLGEFISSDPKGSKLPVYFEQLSSSVEGERQLWRKTISELADSIAHVRAIVQSQSGSLASDEAEQMLSPAKLLSQSLGMFDASIKQHKIHLRKVVEEVPTCSLQRHKVMQVLNNLIMNAIEALSSVDSAARELQVRLDMIGDHRVIFEVSDNGPGINEGFVEKVFSHGFSTKESHSGFGLHSAANLAGEMKGKLIYSQDETLGGACFRLELPVDMNNVG